MNHLHTIVRGLLAAWGLICIASLGGCNRGDNPYPYNCPGRGEHKETEEPIVGISVTVNETFLPSEFPSYQIMYVNPADPDQILATKGGWEVDGDPSDPDQVLAWKATFWDKDQTTLPTEIVVIDLRTMEETVILVRDEPGVIGAEYWKNFRWGEAGWIVAERIRDKQLYLFDPNGGSPRRLTNPALGAYHNPCWVANGKEVLTLGYDVNGQGSRIRTVDLNGEVKQEYMLMDGLPDSFVRYHQFADWRADSLLVSVPPVGRRHDLNIFTYPDMTLLKRIKVVDTTSRSAILRHDWWPGTERILWSIYGALYATDWQTEETEVIWEDCERGIVNFCVAPDGKRVFCTMTDYVMIESIGLREISTHIYELDLSSRVMRKVI